MLERGNWRTISVASHMGHDRSKRKEAYLGINSSNLSLMKTRLTYNLMLFAFSSKMSTSN